MERRSLEMMAGLKGFFCLTALGVEAASAQRAHLVRARMAAPAACVLLVCRVVTPERVSGPAVCCAGTNIERRGCRGMDGSAILALAAAAAAASCTCECPWVLDPLGP